jgi:hypothetical protein
MILTTIARRAVQDQYILPCGHQAVRRTFSSLLNLPRHISIQIQYHLFLNLPVLRTSRVIASIAGLLVVAVVAAAVDDATGVVSVVFDVSLIIMLACIYELKIKHTHDVVVVSVVDVVVSDALAMMLRDCVDKLILIDLPDAVYRRCKRHSNTCFYVKSPYLVFTC